MKPRPIGLLAAVALLLASAALAQGQGRRRAGENPGPPERPREELFRMIEAYVVSNIQESLGLSDEQFVKLLPLVKRLQTHRREFAQRRMRTLLELRRSLDASKASEAGVAELLKELKAIEAEEPPTIRKDQDAIDAALTPVQQAKYRILEVEVERRLRELMLQIRRNSGAGAGRPDGEAPGR